MITEFAKRWELSPWDWLGAIIAFISLVIACIALFFSWKTLKSQKQTEQNTMPIINMDIQEFLFAQLILKLLDAYIKLVTLWHLLTEKKYNYYPSEHILAKLKIDTSVIHQELFYNNHDNYICIDGFIDEIKSYNVNLDVLNKHLQNSAISKDMLYSEFFSCINKNNRIADYWGKIMLLIFNYDNHQKSDLLRNIIIQFDSNQEENKDLRFFNEKEDVYMSFFDSEQEKMTFLSYLNKEANEHISEFSKYIINK